MPCIIQGVSKDWPARHNWTFEKLLERFGKSKFKIGSDHQGKPIQIKLKQYFEYLLYNRDDAPLYMFESSKSKSKAQKKLKNDYTAPKYFRQNLFEHLKEHQMPPSRWFLVGPKRSGTKLH